MIKKLALRLVISSFALVVSSVSLFGAADFFGDGFFVLNLNGAGNVFYDLNPPTATGNPDFGGAFLGAFNPTLGDSLIINGAEFNTFQDGGDDVSLVNLNYRIFSGAAPGFSNFSVDFVSQAGNNKFWQSTTESINALSGLLNGTYTFEVYGDATTTPGTRFFNNGGANFVATFTVVPEPSTLTLLAGPAILGALFYARRRRAS